MFVAVTVRDGMICCKYFMIISFFVSSKFRCSAYTLFVGLFTCYMFLRARRLYVFVSRVKLPPILGIDLVAMRSISLRLD